MKKAGFCSPGLSFREDRACPYISDGREASIEFFYHSGDIAPNLHIFLAGGYRRLGNLLYRNICPGCSSCRPLRVETQMFVPSRSQRRTLRKNSDLRVEILEPCVTPQKTALYRRYVDSKHPSAGDHDREDDAAALSMLYYGYRGSIEMDYYDGDELVGVGIVDEAADALSSAYFYYDMGCSWRSTGVFSILREIALAQSLKKKYYYLGFYIEETPKMSYKERFRPNEVYEDGMWRLFRTRGKNIGCP